MLDQSNQKPLIEWRDVAATVADFMVTERLPDSFLSTVQRFYFPLAQSIVRDTTLVQLTNDDRHRTRLIGINGAQGTGKSTLSALLKRIIQIGTGLNCALVSIDDVYLTLSQRQELARTIHPLLQTRGVPGTHDMTLALGIFEQMLQAQSPESDVLLPGFNKAIDDRKPISDWITQPTPIDIILFEGWCIAAKPQPEEDLITPINALEANEDTHGIWRNYVNYCLATKYQTLFAQLDCLIMLKAPSMEAVMEWRWLQEQKLMTNTEKSLNTTHSKIMNHEQVMRFIQHYERLTRHMLNEMPQRADLVFHLNHDHQIDSVSGPWAQGLTDASLEAQ